MLETVEYQLLLYKILYQCKPCLNVTFWNASEAKPIRLFAGLIEEGYHSTNPYHNAIHATDVTQAMHCFLQEDKVSLYKTYKLFRYILKLFKLLCSTTWKKNALKTPYLERNSYMILLTNRLFLAVTPTFVNAATFCVEFSAKPSVVGLKTKHLYDRLITNLFLVGKYLHTPAVIPRHTKHDSWTLFYLRMCLCVE